MISIKLFIVLIVLAVTSWAIFIAAIKVTTNTAPVADATDTIKWNEWTKEQRKKNGIATWVMLFSGFTSYGLLIALAVLFYIYKMP